ncbi:MAG: hypothetical protein E7600_05540 [Ruminococcaceae bacterium]|nr:hypothetical protein [Oscillospiraceae bacterium]
MTKTKKLATSAVLVALATALALVSMVIPLQLPFGGSVTLASMLPIAVIAYMFGIKWGLGSAFVFSVIQILLGGKTVAAFFMPGDSQMVWFKAVIVCFIDYILAYTVIGFSGIFAKKIKSAPVALCAGSAVAVTLRYVCHIISGAIFFGTWAEGFFAEWGPFVGTAFGNWVINNINGTSLAWFYSVVYNGLYMIPEIILTSVGGFIVAKVLKKYIVAE